MNRDALVFNIQALLDLDAKNALAPHGIGGLARQLFEECKLHLAPVELPTLGSPLINDACWKFIEAMPHTLPGPIFNELKPAFYAAVCHVLTNGVIAR